MKDIANGHPVEMQRWPFDVYGCNTLIIRWGERMDIMRVSAVANRLSLISPNAAGGMPEG